MSPEWHWGWGVWEGEGGPQQGPGRRQSVATGSQKLFSHPVLPELLHRTWKAASTGSGRGAVWAGVCLGGESACTGVQACSWLPRATPGVLRFLWWKSPEKGEQRGGVGARLTLGRFPVPAAPRGFSSGLSSRWRTHEACLCPALSFLPLSSPSSPGAHSPAVGMVSHQREVSPTVGRTTGG